jgi:hypothetical protein
LFFSHLSRSPGQPWTICGEREGRLLYTDSDHLSIYGAQMIVPQFLSIIDGATKSR